jgi:twinkle protein
LIVDQEKILQAKQKLDDVNFTYIMEFLDVKEFDERKMRCLCPLHREQTPSFIYNPKTYSCYCFGCGVSIDFIDAYMKGKGQTFIEAVQKLFELAEIPYSFGEHLIKTKRQYRYPKEVECTDKQKAYSYLAKRKISSSTADYLDMRQDSEGNIVFNYYDLMDILTMVKYRPSKKVEKGENKNWCQPNADTSPILFNVNRINPTQPLVITCGELDCASVIEAGYMNCVSIPMGDSNTNWIEENWDFLEQFKEIVVCHDNDESGYKFAKNVVPRLGSWRCKVAQCPDTFLSTSGTKKPINDINEVLYWFGKEKVLELIANAKDTPIPSVIDFADIPDKDFSDLDGITTGLAPLDQEVMCLPYGSVTIVSGAPGSGKTSILYGLVCQAVEQGTRAWVFSRELPDYTTKGWLNYMLAGPRNVKEFINSKGAKYYKVIPEVKEKLRKYYKNRIYVYRDDYSPKTETLLESMTDSVRKYGTKFLLIDSLMMIDLDSNENNKYEKQSEFVNTLIQFALRFNVAIVLVCHPRKLQYGQTEVGMYDIAGSSNLSNLSHRAIGLRLVTKKEREGEPDKKNGGWKTEPIKFNCIMNIIKDRFRGRTGYEFGLYYDEASRRFFTSSEEYDYKYAWDTTVYKDTIPYPIENDIGEDVFGDEGNN